MQGLSHNTVTISDHIVNNRIATDNRMIDDLYWAFENDIALMPTLLTD